MNLFIPPNKHISKENEKKVQEKQIEEKRVMHSSKLKEEENLLDLLLSNLADLNLHFSKDLFMEKMQMEGLHILPDYYSTKTRLSLFEDVYEKLDNQAQTNFQTSFASLELDQQNSLLKEF